MSLYRELDLDDVAYQQAPCLQSHIPGQAKVFAVDLRPGLEADGLRRTRHWHLSTSGEFGIQHHFARDSSNRQVSDHLCVIIALWLDTGAFERNDGIVLDIQEVGDFRWVSRYSTPEYRVDASISTSTEERDGSASSRTMVPLTFLKWPFTVVNIMCLPENSTRVWFGSSFHMLRVVAVLSLCVVMFFPPLTNTLFFRWGTGTLPFPSYRF